MSFIVVISFPENVLFVFFFLYVCFKRSERRIVRSTETAVGVLFRRENGLLLRWRTVVKSWNTLKSDCFEILKCPKKKKNMTSLLRRAVRKTPSQSRLRTLRRLFRPEKGRTKRSSGATRFPEVFLAIEKTMENMRKSF